MKADLRSPPQTPARSSSPSSAREAAPSGARPDEARLWEPEAIALAKAHFAAIAYIETHLFEPLTVGSIAKEAGLSPSCFSRGFTRLQGESVMAYVRGRRLEAAMRRILTDPDVRLLDLAFDCGFDSQEAFTRAFFRAFGWTPGRFKAEGPPGPLVRRRKPRLPPPVLHERIVALPETTLAGLGRSRLTPGRLSEVMSLWAEVAALAGTCGDHYGVFRRCWCEDGAFDFFAGVTLEPGRTPPTALETITLPGRRYLVFRLLLRGGDIFPQMTAAREHIWSARLPHSGHALADAPFFHVYPADLQQHGGGWIDHFYPLAE